MHSCAPSTTSGAAWCAQRARPSIKYCLLAGLAALCGAAGLACAQAPAEPSRLPTFAELETAGARIGEIHVRPQEIFDLDDPRENNLFFRLANKLHFKTRREVIREALLFESGQALSVQKIEETERLLRGYAFLYDVAIRPVAVHDGVVDIEVLTRDTWSLDISASASREGGQNKGRISVAEENLLGTGISIGMGYTSDVDRKGTTFNISDSTVFGTRGAVAYDYAKNDDGHAQSFSLQRPFYELDARWAAGFGASESDGLESLYNAGNSVAEYRHRRQSVDSSAGWSAGLINGWVRRYSVGFLHQNDEYSLEPGKTAPERLPSDLALIGPYLRFQLIQDEYRQDMNLNLIGRVEDFAMGFQANVQLGRALESLDSTRDAWFYNVNLSNGFDVTRGGFVLTNAYTGGRYADHGENQSVGAAARYYQRQGRRLVYYAALSGDAVHNPDIPGPLTIGGDNGLRGYPLRYQAGERRVLFTTEARAYTDWYPFRLFRVGGAVFFDSGRAWKGENQNTENGGWLKDVGFGLRLLSARSSRGTVLHADFAFPIDRTEDIKSVQFLVRTKVSF
jgi:outer membrane protein assembly factor BamA